MKHIIKNYLPACVAIILATSLLLNDIYFESLTAFWRVVLWTSLFSTLIVMLAQHVHASKEAKNYAEQLTAGKERLTNEIKHRLWAEKSTAESKARSQYVDENIPVMLAYFNAEQRCRYHNRLYRKWFGLKPDQIDGLLLPEFADEEFSNSIINHLDDILLGKTVHEERILKSAKGFPFIFIEQYIPHLDNKGKIVGFYTLHTPRVQEKHLVVSKKHRSVPIVVAEHSVPNESVKTLDEPDTQKAVTAGRISQAIESGKFKIYCQKITPIDKNALLPTQYEVLIRMIEEENNLMPPGSFLPLVDQFGLMPKLDRWVASYMIDWVAQHTTEKRIIFSLNVASDTMRDNTFIAFIQDRLQQTKLPATMLCFEIEEVDANTNIDDAIRFTESIQKLGCSVTLCSFGQSSASMGLLKKMKFDYLKIDGSIVCNMLHDDEDLTRIKGINQIARRLSMKTIAELVETKETFAKLSEIGINYAQGFGIAKPCPLDSLGIATATSTSKAANNLADSPAGKPAISANEKINAPA